MQEEMEFGAGGRRMNLKVSDQGGSTIPASTTKGVLVPLFYKFTNSLDFD